MSTLAASELYPGLIGRRITFDGPNGSRISDELTSIVSFQDNEEVMIRTRNAYPGDPRGEARMYEFGSYWRIGWGVTVEIGERAHDENKGVAVSASSSPSGTGSNFEGDDRG